MQWASLFPWIWRGLISFVGVTTLWATVMTAASSPGRRRTPTTHHQWRSLWETLGPAYFSQTDLQRPSCDFPSDPWSAASEQTSHWQVSSSNTSAGAPNNCRIDGASVCLCARVLLWRWLGKCCHMSYHYSPIPQFRELFDSPSTHL